MAQDVARLPDVVIEHIYSDALDAWYRAFFRDEALSEAEREAVEEAVSDVYHRRVTLDAFITRLAEVFGDKTRGTAVAIAVLGNDLVHIEDHLGVDVAAYIKHLGGDPAQFVREAQLEELVGELVGRFADVVPDAAARRRLAVAIESLLVNARTSEQTVAALTRGAKIGGIGLDVPVARRVVDATVARRDELAAQHVRIVRGSAQPSSFGLVKPAVEGLRTPEDDAEIAEIRAAAPQREGLDVSAAVERVIARCGARFQRADVERRFRAAVASRLRDVRDTRETRDVLARPQAQGGLGIPADVAAKILGIVEEEYAVLTGNPVAPKRTPPAVRAPHPAPPLPHPTPPPTTPVLVPPKQAPPVPPPPPPRPALPPPSPEHFLPAATPQRTMAAPPMPPVARVAVSPAPVPRPSPRPPVPAAVPPPRPSVTPAERPMPPAAPPQAVRPMPSVPPARQPQPAPRQPAPSPLPDRALPAAPAGKQRVTDVRPPRPRLVGPLEELEALTPEDFRKIGREPSAAAARIREKIDLLGQQSYALRATGIAAFRRSPLMARYADALNAAVMEGKPIHAVESELTQPELSALMALAASMRV